MILHGFLENYKSFPHSLVMWQLFALSKEKAFLRRCTKHTILSFLAIGTLVTGCGTKPVPNSIAADRQNRYALTSLSNGVKILDLQIPYKKPDPQFNKFDTNELQKRAEEAFETSKKIKKKNIGDINLVVFFKNAAGVRLTTNLADAAGLNYEISDSRKGFIVKTDRKGVKENKLNKLLSTRKGIVAAYVYATADTMSDDEADIQEKLLESRNDGKDVINEKSKISLHFKDTSVSEAMKVIKELNDEDIVQAVDIMGHSGLNSPEYFQPTTQDPGIPYDATTWQTNTYDQANRAWYLQRMSFVKAWTQCNYGLNNSVKVGVVDTGFNTGSALDRPTYDLVNSATIFDYNGGTSVDTTLARLNHNMVHGTEVTSVLASQINNGIGWAGGAPHATIVPIRAEAIAPDFWSDIVIANAIKRACDVTGVRVVSCSMGHSTNNETFLLYRDAYNYVRLANKLMVTSSSNQKEEWGYDGSIFTGAVVCGGIGKNEDFGTDPYGGGSARGQRIDVCSSYEAGVTIVSEENPSDVGISGWNWGTSFSAPLVAAAAALAFATNPAISNWDVRESLIYGSDFSYGDPNVGTSNPQYVGGAGCVNQAYDPRIRVLNAANVVMLAQNRSTNPLVIGSNITGRQDSIFTSWVLDGYSALSGTNFFKVYNDSQNRYIWPYDSSHNVTASFATFKNGHCTGYGTTGTVGVAKPNGVTITNSRTNSTLTYLGDNHVNWAFNSGIY